MEQQKRHSTILVKGLNPIYIGEEEEGPEVQVEGELDLVRNFEDNNDHYET